MDVTTSNGNITLKHQNDWKLKKPVDIFFDTVFKNRIKKLSFLFVSRITKTFYTTTQQQLENIFSLFNAFLISFLFLFDTRFNKVVFSTK